MKVIAVVWLFLKWRLPMCCLTQIRVMLDLINSYPFVGFMRKTLPTCFCNITLCGEFGCIWLHFGKSLLFVRGVPGNFFLDRVLHSTMFLETRNLEIDVLRYYGVNIICLAWNELVICCNLNFNHFVWWITAKWVECVLYIVNITCSSMGVCVPLVVHCMRVIYVWVPYHMV